MTKKLFYTILLGVLILSPVVIVAAPFDAGTRPAINLNANLQTFLEIIGKVLSFTWTIFIGFAVIMFIVAGFYFLTAQGDPIKVGDARRMVLWGVIGVATGVLAFTIPFFIQNMFR